MFMVKHWQAWILSLNISFFAGVKKKLGERLTWIPIKYMKYGEICSDFPPAAPQHPESQLCGGAEGGPNLLYCAV